MEMNERYSYLRVKDEEILHSLLQRKEELDDLALQLVVLTDQEIFQSLEYHFGDSSGVHPISRKLYTAMESIEEAKDLLNQEIGSFVEVNHHG